MRKRGACGWSVERWRVWRGSVLIASLALAIIGGGCNGTCVNGTKVRFPSADTTPPTLAALDAHFPSQAMQSVTNSSSPVTAKIVGTPEITLIAGSEDPEGAGEVEIWVEQTQWRSASQVGPGLLGAAAASSATPRPSSTEGCTRNLATYKIDVAQLTRGFTALRIRAWAEAKNTAGASVKSQVMQLDWP